jgi:hypothetical protein
LPTELFPFYQRPLPPLGARVGVGRIGRLAGRLSSQTKVLQLLAYLPIGSIGRIILTYYKKSEEVERVDEREKGREGEKTSQSSQSRIVSVLSTL